MIGKLVEATQLLLSNLLLFSLIVLTVWLPGNLLTNYLWYYGAAGEAESSAAVWLSMYIEGIFGPFYIGALIYALAELKLGRRPAYPQAIVVGLKNWGRLFVARLVAGVIILLGFILLVIPGIVLSLRYALLDSAVILEGANGAEARQRSTELTEGLKLRILGTAMLFFPGMVLFSVLIYGAVGLVPQVDSMAVGVVLDCLLDVMYLVITIAMFLFYWEARQREHAVEEPAAAAEPESDEIAEIQDRLGEAAPDGNPYRSPQA